MKPEERFLSTLNQANPLSPTVCRLANVVGSNDSTVDDVVEVVRFDQAVTLEILKLANSAFHASSRPITAIRDAVIRLGASRILALLCGRSISKTILTPLPGYGYGEEELWRHSVASAIAAETLGRIAHNIPGLSFTAALLHDIGKLALSRGATPEEISTVLRLIETEDIAWEEAERKVFGVCHAALGAAIAHAWEVPEEITESIRLHHHIQRAPAPLVDVVIIANVAARCIGEGIGHQGMAICADSACRERLNISKEQFESVCAHTAQSVDQVMTLYRA